MAEEQTTPQTIEDVKPPTITKHEANRAGSTPAQDAANILPAEEQPTETIISNKGTNITPLASATTPEPTVTNENPPEAPNEPVEHAQEQKSSISPTAYEASDSLPDMSEKRTTELTDEMQTPRIYDTKEYIVPIHDTVHSHGTTGKIVAGIVSGLVVLIIVIVAAYAIGG
ncbi:MAG: hypothetical protein R3B12_04510 [Candidatus Saccharimonadales bacterium]